MSRRDRDSAVSLRRSSAGGIPVRIGRLSAGLGRRHPVTIRKASLMPGLTRRVLALWHQTGAQYSAVELPGLRWLFTTLLLQHRSQSQQAASGVRRVMSTFCEVTQGVGDMWATSPTVLRGRLFGFGAQTQISLLWLTFTFSFLVVKVEEYRHHFVVLSFSFQVWRYSLTVALFLLSTPSTACQCPLARMIARLSAYAYFLETLVCRLEM